MSRRIVRIALMVVLGIIQDSLNQNLCLSKHVVKDLPLYQKSFSMVKIIFVRLPSMSLLGLGFFFLSLKAAQP